MNKPIRTLISVAVVGLLANHTASAGSFSLYTEGSAAAVSNYAAGIAAEVYDASTSWYNPAGLVFLNQQEATIGGVGVFPNSKLTGTSTFSTPPLPDYVQSFREINGGKNALVPSLHYALPLGDRFAFGLSMVAPFGLSTSWSSSGPLRYAATLSELMTSDLSPSLGAKITENFSLGAGIDLEYSKVKFNKVLGSPAFISALSPFINDATPNFLDSTSYNKGSSVGVGFHAGALLALNENHSRVGVNYQSRVQHKFHGYSRLTGRLASPDLNVANPASLLEANENAVFKTRNLTSNSIEFPDITTLSVYQDVTTSFALLGSVVYTGWKSLKTIELNNVAAFVPGVGQAPVNSVSTQYYHNTWRFAAGANYKVNQRWMLRAGGGYDQSPTNDQNRDIRIADSDRWALSIGTHYQARPNLGVDVGYTHLFSAKDALINKTEIAGETSTSNVSATATGSADLVGLQLTWLIDGVEPVATK